MEEIDYDAEEAKLDADIAKMLGQAPEESDTAVETTTISNEPAEAETSTTDQKKEETEEEQVPISRLKNAQARMTQATQEAADLRRKNSELEGRLTQLEGMIAKLQSNQHQDDSTDDDDLKSVMEDYPEIAGPLAKKNKALEAKIQQLEQALSGVKTTSDQFAQTQYELAQQKHDNAIRSAHPDYDELRAPERFEEVEGWVKQQAPIIQHGFYNGSSADVITVLTLYKQANGLNSTESKPDKLAAAKAAATPNLPKNTSKPSSQKQTFTREQIAKMSMEEFMKHEAEIDAAIASGEVY